MAVTSRIHIDELIRSDRKTLSLAITEDARLVVRAPRTVPLSYIEELIRRKAEWISIRQKEALARRDARPARAYAPGEIFPFLGAAYRLVLDPDGSRIGIRGGSLTLPGRYAASAGKWIESWYRREALRIFLERVSRFKSVTGLRSGGVRLSGARKRWGSCNARGGLNFSWRLVAAPLEAIDYVVVHELAHTVHRNHSRDFWALVESVLPDYRVRRKLLREHQPVLRDL